MSSVSPAPARSVAPFRRRLGRRRESTFGVEGALWLVLCCFLPLACRSPAPPPLTPGVRALMAAGQPLGALTGAEVDRGLVDLVAVASQVRAAMRRQPRTAPADLLNSVIFDQLAFLREVDSTDLRFVLLPKVLEGRRGSCVGLATLYLAVAEMLNLPMEAVLVPGHVYVRVDEGGRRRNIELLNRGEEKPARWYRARYPAPGPLAARDSDRPHGRVLTRDEVMGVIAYNVGQEYRRAADLRAAQGAYRRAVRQFPAFAEAHASLGATLQLAGELTAARAAYEEARRLDRYLPGIDENLALLRQEQEGGR